RSACTTEGHHAFCLGSFAQSKLVALTTTINRTCTLVFARQERRFGAAAASIHSKWSNSRASAAKCFRCVNEPAASRWLAIGPPNEAVLVGERAIKRSKSWPLARLRMGESG